MAAGGGHGSHIELSFMLWKFERDPQSKDKQTLLETNLGLALGKMPRPSRLLATELDWENLPLRLAGDPFLQRLASRLKERAEFILSQPLLEHRLEGKRRLTFARLLQGRLLVLSAVARLEGSGRCIERVHRELEPVLAMPDWGPSHFLDVAEYALAVSVAFDWLHETFSKPQGDRLVRALMDKAILPSFAPEPKGVIWLGGRSNWTQVCHAGLAAAALVVAGHEPRWAARTLARAIAEQSGPASVYAPDGAYPEGPMYWTYGTTFQVILLSLLDKAFNNDFGLAAFPGFLESADYIHEMIGPSGTFFNYADAREEVPAMPVCHWFARRRGCSSLARREMARVMSGISAGAPVVEPVYERLDALALWWHRPLPEGTGDSRLPLAWLGRGQTPVAVMRLAWDDSSAAFLGIKGGSPGGGHGHMDAGSFVYESDGVRWAVDTGMQDYLSLEKLGLGLWDQGQEGERWNIFRLGPDSHNIIRFGTARQKVSASAQFSHFDAVRRAAELNLSPLYEGQISALHRHFRLADDGSMILEDRWQAGEKALDVAWQWLTRSEVLSVPGGVLLREKGQALMLEVSSPSTWSLDVQDGASLLKPCDEFNPGLRRIVIRLHTEAGRAGRLKVKAQPGSSINQAP